METTLHSRLSGNDVVITKILLVVILEFNLIQLLCMLVQLQVS